MPGVLLIRNRWRRRPGLADHRITGSSDAVPASVRDAKVRTFVSPGQVLSLPQHRSRGFGLAGLQGDGGGGGRQDRGQQRDHVPRDGVRTRSSASMLETAAAIDFPVKAHG